MLNRCEFIGNLGRDVEVRSTQSGKRIANLYIAVTEKYKDRNGERQEKTEWVRAVIFSDGLVDVAEKYLRKGSKVFIAGKMQTRKWTDQNGIEKYSTEIVLDNFSGVLVMLDSKPDSTKTATENYSQPSVAPSDELEDEIPFAPAWGLER